MIIGQGEYPFQKNISQSNVKIGINLSPREVAEKEVKNF